MSIRPATPKLAPGFRPMPILVAVLLSVTAGVQVSADDVTTLEEARRVAVKALAALQPPRDFKIHDKETIEKGYGWIFFYSPKGTGDSHAYGLGAIGAGPLVIEREGGNWQFLGTTVPPEAAIESYEKRMGHSQKGRHGSRQP